MGTTGESATLTEAKQQACIDTVLEANAQRLPVVLGVGGNHTREVAEKLTHWSNRFNPAGFLSVSPYYNKPTQAGIVEHYAVLAQHTDKPILLYNVPHRTSSNLLAATTVQIAHRCPSIVGIKEASGNLEQGMEILRDAPPGFAVLSGDDTLALPQIACGYTGCISVVGNTLPEVFSRLIRLALQGHFTEARALQLQVLSFLQLLFREGNPAGVKAALHAQGICEPTVRLPLLPASTELQAAIRQAMQVLAA
jgi:4-hydroxy-tetrahydrodipicolinate synthase